MTDQRDGLLDPDSSMNEFSHCAKPEKPCCTVGNSSKPPEPGSAGNNTGVVVTRTGPTSLWRNRDLEKKV
ncbi:hypothetical protein Rhow_000439 [Rhodococcus wratislaviensis]|uniref:Uncharacterized protein n=1 Tax=Rhodococcus wratislaviensis TaxID=44752 RepID=A0A402CMR6_RHOWR|nr:hypothetical protein Rhow_000439 [Rhodococcus wratislaviensis]